MKTVLITGGIGSGKSLVCGFLAARGVKVYDSDSEAKSLYDRRPELASRIGKAFGRGVMLEDGRVDMKALSNLVFSDSDALRRLEDIVHPAVYADFEEFRKSCAGAPVVVFESAIALQRGFPEGLFDEIVHVDSPLQLRVERASLRDGTSRVETMGRVAVQPSVADDPRITMRIANEGSMADLEWAALELLKKLMNE